MKIPRKWLLVIGLVCVALALWKVVDKRHAETSPLAVDAEGLSSVASRKTESAASRGSTEVSNTISAASGRQAGEGSAIGEPGASDGGSAGSLPSLSAQPRGRESSAGAAGRESSLKPGGRGHGNGSSEVGKVESQESSSPPPGLRLAPDVRLPAAALPIDFELTPAAAKALQAIVDDYHRDLAAGYSAELDGSAEQGAGGARVEVGENGERTVVVPNGLIAESARRRADQRFRALFGNQAFNRMTIQSALERRLPDPVVQPPVEGEDK